RLQQPSRLGSRSTAQLRDHCARGNQSHDLGSIVFDDPGIRPRQPVLRQARDCLEQRGPDVVVEIPASQSLLVGPAAPGTSLAGELILQRLAVHQALTMRNVPYT